MLKQQTLRTIKIPTYIPRRYQPIYDLQEINRFNTTIEFFQNPIIETYNELIETRDSSGRFAGKKYIHHPQKRNYSETNMLHPGYLPDDYYITGLSLIPSKLANNNIVDTFSENSFLEFNIYNKTWLQLPVSMVMSAAFTFAEVITLPEYIKFSVKIISPEMVFNTDKAFKLRCILDGFFDS